VPAPAPTPTPAPGPAPSPYNPTQLDPENVTQAWAVGGSPTSNQGQGVKVGILDSGVQATNPALINRISWFKDYVDPTNTTPQDPYGHGTVIAQVIGGTANPDGGEGTYFYGGVAPQSSLYVARVGDSTGEVNVALAPQALLDLAAQGVQLINNSYGSTVAITDPTNGQALASQRYSLYFSIVNNQQLMVWSAGNNGNSQPSVEAGLPYYDSSLEKNWIAVVNVSINASGQVSGLDPTSNACGVAAGWCLSAAGNTYVTPVTGTAFSLGAADGTSNSAAVVTGVAALVWQRFPYFTPSNVQETLLGTATNLGNSAIYGYGLVNAAAAVNGPELLNWGVFDTNIPIGVSSTFSNDIVGSGSIKLDGAGSLTLTGQNNFGGVTMGAGTLTVQGQDTYTNGATIYGGTLQLAGTINGDVSISQAGALMSMSNAVINGNVASAAVLSTDNGALQINGNLTVSQNFLGVNAATHLGVGNPLSVSGTATISGVTALEVDLPNNYVFTSNPQILLSANGGLNGTFSSWGLNGSLYYSGALSYTATQLDITITQNSVQSVADSMPALATTQQTAQHLQTALRQVNAWSMSAPSEHKTVLDAASDFYDVQSVAQAQASIDSLSGQLLASSQALTFEQAGIVNRTVADRLADVGNGDAQQGAWFQGTGASGDIARTGYATGHYNGGGSVAGYDVKVADDFTLGVGLDWNRLGSDYNLQGGSNSSRSTGVMLYGKFAEDNFYLSGRVGEDWIHSNTSRWGLLGMVPAAITSSRNDNMTSAYLEVGFDAKSSDWTTTPFVSAGDEHLDRGAIAEQGAGGFGIAAPNDDFNQSYAQIGARLAYHWNWSNGQLSLKGFALYQRVLGGQNLGFTAAYAGAPNATFELEGVNSPRNTGWVGVGLNADMSKHWTVFANLDGQVAGGNTKATVFSAGARFSF
jgi:outer membrane autotransporter protein